jgi:alpha-L-arabinofuranosidase
MKTTVVPLVALATLAMTLPATEFHVATNGNDANRGTKTSPLRTIQRAADLAQPGDAITVHQGVYRERLNPPRGGDSDRKRIVYQAAKGEKVEIKGSEVVKGWTKVQDDVWKVTLPNLFFGSFNPYSDLIHGDWFNPKGRQHHTGAVYLNGDWLTEAASLEEVLSAGAPPAWLAAGGQDFLLNVAWLRPGTSPETKARTPASGFAAHHGVQTAPCSEGGECIGWIEHGDWVRYDRLDLGQRADEMEIRAASATDGGLIEIHLDAPDGALLGSCSVPNTGGWQSWSSFHAKLQPIGGVKTICLVFKGRKAKALTHTALNPQLWFAQVDATNTTFWAQFKGVSPNEQLVEINVRRTVFYPDQPGRNYITVRGFALSQAATPWAPPTAEQIGLIGTHWSKGWVIENNRVSYSTCSGIALGKYGDQWDNTSANSAEGYVKTIDRALKNGWNKDTIGHHLVRNNTVSHCEQAGIVGSLGAAFSTVTGNTIHDIHVRQLFSGAEMAGIKFHAAIDTVIRGNHIYRTCRGLWLDWMAQGTRVSGNLFHDNATEDLFLEVDHGPFVVDNNLFLSGTSVSDMSEGGAFAHNLFCGKIVNSPEPRRVTPFHPAHSTALAGLVDVKGGDDRFYNNIFIGNATVAPRPNRPAARAAEWVSGYGLTAYDQWEFPLQTAGNVFYRGAQPYLRETNAVVQPEFDPQVKLVEDNGQFILQLSLGPALKQANTVLVTTALLGKARVPGLLYENADGSALKLNTDYFGKKRGKAPPSPGPFENPDAASRSLRVW